MRVLSDLVVVDDLGQMAGEGDSCRHLTSLRFCCAAKMVTASEAREPDVYRDCSNRLLDGAPDASVVNLPKVVGC